MSDELTDDLELIDIHCSGFAAGTIAVREAFRRVERLARLGVAVIDDYAGWGDSTSWDIADFGKHVQQIIRDAGYEGITGLDKARGEESK